MPSGDAAHVAQHRFDAVGDAVRSDVLAAVGVGPVVDVDRIDMGGTAFGSDDRQHTRTAAHIEPATACDTQVEHGTRHEPGGRVVPRAERHLGHDDHLHHPCGGRLMERRPDQQAPFDVHRREIALPDGVPVLRLDGDIASLHAVMRQQGIDLALAVGQPLLGDIGLERPRIGLETLEGIVGQLGGQDLGLQVVRKGNIQGYIVHIM